MLRIQPLGIAFRRNGDTAEYYGIGNSSGSGTSAGKADSSIYICYVVATDNAGIIEWKTANAASGLL